MRESTLVLLSLVAFLAGKGYPEYGWWPWVLPLGYAAIHAYRWWTVTRLERAREQVERNQLYLQVKEHSRLLEAIRDKYDPRRVWNEGTSTPWAYQQEVRQLNDDYHDVLRAWFGPSWDDEDAEEDEGDTRR
jgi:hypothetical protein